MIGDIKDKRCSIRLVCLIAVMAMTSGGACAATLTVDDSGGAMYKKIQDAINYASNGDTIQVHNGTYYEDLLIFKNNLTITGEDKNATNIIGSLSESASQSMVVDIKASNVYFGGFNITRKYDNVWGYTFKAYAQISRNSNKFERNKINGDILLIRYSNGNIIRNNEVQTIFIDEANKNTVSDNEVQELRIQLSDENIIGSNEIQDFVTFEANRTTVHDNQIQALSAGNSNENILYNNKIQSLSLGSSDKNIIRNNEVLSLSLENSNKNTIYQNNFLKEYGDNPGISIRTSYDNIINNNTISSNSWKYGGISLTNSSNNSMNSNNITGGRYGILIQLNSNNNTISNNIIQRSLRFGVSITRSGSNRLYQNTFNSAKNANDYSGFNVWENNYFSDYTGQDIDKDGIGDTPYFKISTNAGSQDKHPLEASPCNCTLLQTSTSIPAGPSGYGDFMYPDSGDDMSDDMTCVWTYRNFHGFYHEPDTRGRNESLRVNLDSFFDRTVDANNIIYITTPDDVRFAYSGFGNYTSIRLTGERYLAGYTAESRNITNIPINMLKRAHLYKILMDDNFSRTLIIGNNLMLGEGYILMVKDVSMPRATALVSLWKDRNEVDTKNIGAGEYYVYGINGTDGSLPVIAVGLDSVNRDSVSIKGIFQILDSYMPVDIGTKYGIMKVADVSDKGIVMVNTNLLHPARGETIDLMDNIKLKAADSDILRFYLHNGTKEPKEDAECWFDLNTGSYSESLEVTNLSGRIIPEGHLKYTIAGARVPFSITRITGMIPDGTDGAYTVVDFGADKYSAIKGKSNRLARILIDQITEIYNKRTLVMGETWEMGDGYSLYVKEIDTRDSPRKARLVLSRNGVELSDKWISSGNIYSYIEKNMSGEEDVPVFITYLDAVFAGSTIDMIQVRYTWLTSGNVTVINEGDRFGIFKVTRTDQDFIELKNEKPVELKVESNLKLIGNLSIAVANSSDLWFYPGMMNPRVTPQETIIKDSPGATAPVEDRKEQTAGFEIFVSIITLLSAYIFYRNS